MSSTKCESLPIISKSDVIDSTDSLLSNDTKHENYSEVNKSKNLVSGSHETWHGDYSLLNRDMLRVFDMENSVVHRRRPLRKDDNTANNIFGGPVDTTNRPKINPRITKSQIFKDEKDDTDSVIKRKSYAVDQLPPKVVEKEVNGYHNGHANNDITLDSPHDQDKKIGDKDGEERVCGQIKEVGGGEVQVPGVKNSEGDKEHDDKGEGANSEDGGHGDDGSSLNTTQNVTKLYVTRGGLDSQENYKRNQRGMYNPITGESYD